MRRCAWLVMLLVLLVAGCIPERVVWSPDGSRAVLLAPDGLHVMDAQGKVGPVLFEGISRVVWLPDGQRIVVASSMSFSSWEEVIKTLPDRALEAGVAEKVKAALGACRGDWKKFEELTLGIVEDQRARALLYLRDQDANLPDVAGAVWPNVVETSYSIPICYTLDLTNPSEVKAGPVIYHGLHGTMMELRISPKGDAAAITLTSHRDKAPESAAARLCVAPLNLGEKPLLLGLGNKYVDWSADGRSIVYQRPIALTLIAGSPARAGSLVRQAVMNGEGELFSQEHLPPREELLQVGYDVSTRVRVMGDGRIYFSAAGVAGPGAPFALGETQDLWVYTPGGGGERAKRLVAEASRPLVGDDLNYFQPSPDGAYVALPFGDGRISLLTVSTGEVKAIQDLTIVGMKNELVTVPTWRGTRELTFARPPATGGRVRELVRYAVADGATVVLSKDWDDNLRRDWLIPTPEESRAGGILP